MIPFGVLFVVTSVGFNVPPKKGIAYVDRYEEYHALRQFGTCHKADRRTNRYIALVIIA